MRRTKSDFDHVKSIILSRANLLQLIVVAIGISLGVNLFASGLVAQLRLTPSVVLILSTILIAIMVALFVVWVSPAIEREITFEGVLPVKKSQNEIAEIKRYSFSQKVSDFVRGLKAENKSLAKAWSENPLSDFVFEGGGKIVERPSPANKLAKEAIEYFVLDQLSLHLSAYFGNNEEIELSEIVTLARRDIPSVLLDNRFLELFSRPMEERDAFGPHSGAGEGKTVFAYGADGAIYDNFELILPKNTHVHRVDGETIIIKTPRFELRIEVGMSGTSVNLPTQFEELYEGLPIFTINPYKAVVAMHVKFKWTSLLTRSGWEYYQWLDSFLDSFDEDFSFEQFLEKIGWETAVSAATAVRNSASRGKKPAAILSDQSSSPKNKSPQA